MEREVGERLLSDPEARDLDLRRKPDIGRIRGRLGDVAVTLANDIHPGSPFSSPKD